MDFSVGLDWAIVLDNCISESSCLQIFYKVGVLKISPVQMFSNEFCKTFLNIFFIEQLCRLTT